jgi:hypothetical protein
MQAKTLLLALLLLSAAGAAAQTTLQVVTQTTQKNLRWKPGTEVEIICEKAEVEVEATEQQQVTVSADLSARHPRLDSAQADVKAWKLVTSALGKKIYIRAYIGVSAGQPPPGSHLKARIRVQVPKGCPVTLNNKFGKARLENISGALRLTGEFCAFTLRDVQGSVRVQSSYGNVDGSRIGGPVEVQSKRSDVSLSGLRSHCTVRSEYGTVTLEASAQTGNLSVQATKCDVTVDAPDPPRHNFQLRTSYGELHTPAQLRFDTGGSSGNTRQASLRQGADKPQVNIETNFGKIIIR